MSPAERWRAHPLARRLVEAMRSGALTRIFWAAEAHAQERGIEAAAADYLEAGLAEPAPVAGVSAEERARIQESVARLRTEQERATGGWRSGLDRAMSALVPHVDRLLDAAEARAVQVAQAARAYRDAVESGYRLSERDDEIWSASEDLQRALDAGGDAARALAAAEERVRCCSPCDGTAGTCGRCGPPIVDGRYTRRADG